ncbi:uncharacterized protein LOC111344469 [Stylophora pistillata]|uniref:Uncharacterized protein n=1 Tax=Stylophora pistillata TaxID=50429 RepID=A0A2B4RD22_STYPI|nr:uncharacterized protein LOC111344469 [Stylophora pistillata]PFX14693.1 hypothetical protein AWC38_SpisGene21131 [Stylophora pistillata]
MDVSDSPPIWPSPLGPRVPDLDKKIKKTGNPNMDTALAWLRRELAAMQLQDRDMHKQLLTMRSSISSLREELKSEREEWELENQQDTPEPKPTHARGYVTKVEVISNEEGELRISHAKQDSGILSDEERSDEDLEESVQELLKTFPPPVRPRSSSFSFSSKYTNYGVKREENGFGEAERGPTRGVARARARSVAGIEVERLSTDQVSPRNRIQSVADGTFNRFASMPVINEIPGDALQRNTPRSKTFAFYGYGRQQSEVEDDNRVSYSSPKKLPVVFGSLTRHGSMPVMHSGGRPRSGTGSKNTNDNVRLFISNQPIKRSASQIVLSRPAWDKARVFESNQMRPCRVYRSTSQVSLV